MQEIVGMVSDMKNDYDRRISQSKDNSRKNMRVDWVIWKINSKKNENLISLIMYSHKVVKNYAKSIYTMVGNLESLHQGGTTVDVDALEKNKEETVGTCKRTRASLKNKSANQDIYKVKKIALNMTQLETEAIEALKKNYFFLSTVSLLVCHFLLVF